MSYDVSMNGKLKVETLSDLKKLVKIINQINPGNWFDIYETEDHEITDHYEKKHKTTIKIKHLTLKEINDLAK